jgi:hypothetical protein
MGRWRGLAPMVEDRILRRKKIEGRCSTDKEYMREWEEI